MFGLQFIAVNFLYLVFSLFIGIIIYIILAKKEKFTSIKRISIGIGTFLVVWMLPYYDLFIQKGIKTYYETFKMNNTIYAYPERDKDGKIESLGIGKNIFTNVASYLKNQRDLIDLKNGYVAKDFLEFYFNDSFEKVVDKDGKVSFKNNYKKDIGYARVYFNETPIRYEKIKDESEYKARYQLLGKDESGFFYNKTLIEFWDMKEHKLLAKGFKLDFYTEDYDQKFRNKYLLFRGPSGRSLVINYLEHFGFDYRKVLKNK